MKRIGIVLLVTGIIAATIIVVLAAAQHDAGPAVLAPEGNPKAITIDYPLNGSVFPPEFTPPTFIWRDASEAANLWRIDVTFADGSAGMRLESRGDRLSLGEIDQRCISTTNELPKLTPKQAAAHTWIPDAMTWEKIKEHSVAGPAEVIITGFSQDHPKRALSDGRVAIQTSKDPVGAPIFYRDVPLMPSETEKGIIKPLAAAAIPLIQWRLRSINQPQSRVVLTGIYTCANCHSFSRDGKTMGMDMDGPGNDKALYALVPVKPQMSIGNEDMVSWNPSQDRQYALNRVGFMSQVSPDGQYVLTTLANFEGPPQNNIYVKNFKDYRFLQVFYPTRGILTWYSRATGQRHPLPGADDPRYVQTDGVWSPDGEYVVFARAEAREPYPADGKMAAYANDPNEVRIQYDLYRIPFNGGRGGQAEPIAGASGNGMSNTFPKVSPDGRWIVFVKCRNGQLMRPDSQLYIVPAQGGQARRLRANMSPMNSWHSFSPNGRWLVFSSKSRSPYTQMYLTHIDEEGNDSPAILVENSTAANRAVNIPEFVNIPPDGLLKINTPAVDMYKQIDHAAHLLDQGQYEAAIVEWKELAAANPDDPRILRNLGLALALSGKFEEAIPQFDKALEVNPQYIQIHAYLAHALMGAGRVDEAIPQFQKALEFHPESPDLHNDFGAVMASRGNLDEATRQFEKAIEIDPRFAKAHNNLGMALLSAGQLEQATSHFQKAVEINPQFAEAHCYLGTVLYTQGRVQEACQHWREALRLEPNNTLALSHFAHALAASPQASDRDGAEAVKLAERAVELSGGLEPAYLDALGMACAEAGRFADAIEATRRALELATRQGQTPFVEALNARIRLYEAKQPYRDATEDTQ